MVVTAVLPIPGASGSVWGSELNTWLLVAHNADGTLQLASQSFALANLAYQTLLSWTVTGQTDSPLPAFGLIAGSQTYGSSPAIQGPAFWLGYNPALGSNSVSSSAHGSVGMSCFGDAGDSNNGAGRHGMEMNPATFRSPDGTKVTNALEMVGIDDNTNTVTLTLRCGTGNVNGFYSGIVFQNSDASVNYMQMGPSVSNEISILRPTQIGFDTNALGSNMLDLLNTNVSSLGSAEILIDCNNTTGVDLISFNKSGVPQWITAYGNAGLANWYYIEDAVNGRIPFRIAPGASAAAQQITLDGQTSFTAGTNTSASAPALTPSFANGTAAQLSDTARDYMVYLTITTAGTASTLAIGPTSTPANVIKSSTTATLGDIWSFRLPAGWYVKWAGTTTAIATQTAIGC
jgi:hypothetical protein